MRRLRLNNWSRLHWNLLNKLRPGLRHIAAALIQVPRDSTVVLDAAIVQPKAFKVFLQGPQLGLLAPETLRMTIEIEPETQTYMIGTRFLRQN